MPRFLHLADIHLGFDRYDSPERTKDFFLAFYDALERYAIKPAVDFVVVAGDLFEHRAIQPAVLNQAQICLGMLREAGIPALAIEGNHDNRPYGTKTSWLRYLADWGLLILLEPGDPSQGEAVYQPWDGTHGGYIDLDCGVRVLGSYWYGASAPQAIAQLAAAIAELPPGPDHSIMLFHHGLEGQIGRYAGALRYNELLPLKQAGIDYLALGHIHKHYTVDNWIFNPGSLEANNVEEADYQRGVYLVMFTAEGIHAELKQDYYQRSIVRLRLTAKGQERVEEIEQAAIATVETAIRSRQLNPDDQPIVELRLDGQVGFDRAHLDIRRLQQHLKQLTNALVVLLKYEANSVEYMSPLSDHANRLAIEQEIFADLVTANATYRHRVEPLSQGLIGLKDLQMEGRSDEELYQFVENLLASTQSELNVNK